jgi:Asp/Glu/hydantoin racemase
MPTFWVIYEGTRFPVRRGETMIGRSAYCTIVVSDVSVSREHASLRLVDDVLLLTDHGSRNGTLVNDVNVTGTQPVKAGDAIVLGSAPLRIEATDDSASSRRPTGNLLGGPEEPTTQTTTSLVELVHRLVDETLASGGGAKSIPLVRSVVDSLVESVAKGFKLAEGDRPKLARATAFVVACSGDPALEVWRKIVLGKLGIEP